MLKIRLLGHLEVSAHGRALSFDTKKSEALLTMLVLRPGQALSREAIVSELWGDIEETRAWIPR